MPHWLWGQPPPLPGSGSPAGLCPRGVAGPGSEIVFPLTEWRTPGWAGIEATESALTQPDSKVLSALAPLCVARRCSEAHGAAEAPRGPGRNRTPGARLPLRGCSQPLTFTFSPGVPGIRLPLSLCSAWFQEASDGGAQLRCSSRPGRGWGAGPVEPGNVEHAGRGLRDRERAGGRGREGGGGGREGGGTERGTGTERGRRERERAR